MNHIYVRVIDKVPEIMILCHGLIELHFRKIAGLRKMCIIHITKCNQTITLVTCKMIF